MWHHDVGQEALVRPAGERRHQQQVAGGGDRQEFGDALDQGQDDDLEDDIGCPGCPWVGPDSLAAGAGCVLYARMNRSNRGANLLLQPC